MLDMALEARMARAKEMGFDTDNVYYHGTNADFDEFDLSRGGQNFGDASSKEGVFLQSTKDGVGHYGDNIKSLVTKSRAKVIDAESLLKDEYEYLKKRGEYDGGFEDFINEFTEGDHYGFYEVGSLFSDIKQAKKDGFDALEIDFGSISSQMKGRAQKFRVEFDPKNMRNADAAFDPAKKDSPNLLAGIAPVGIGVAGYNALSPQQAVASTISPTNPLAPSPQMLANMPYNKDQLRAPVAPMLLDVADKMQGYSDWRDKNLPAPVNWLLPFQPDPEYVRNRAYGREPTKWEKVKFGLSFL